MEILRLSKAYCSSTDRADLSATLGKVVAVIVGSFPKDTVVLGKLFPHDRSLSEDASLNWWLIGYNLRQHMIYAQPVSRGHSAHIMAKRTLISTVDGAKCEFDASEWRACVTTEKQFYQLDVRKLSDDAVVASFLNKAPARYNLELGYSKYILGNEEKNVVLPYASAWLELDIPSGVELISIPEGVKHVSITASLSEPFIRLPDSLLSCHIDEEVRVRLSISKKLSKHWDYWSAVWGRHYSVKDGFTQTPDGLVVVRR